MKGSSLALNIRCARPYYLMLRLTLIIEFVQTLHFEVAWVYTGKMNQFARKVTGFAAINSVDHLAG
jgi:hypothetical protein